MQTIVKGLKRDPKYIKSLVEIKDGKIYCKEKCIIEYPSWYEDKGLGGSFEEVSMYGIFAIIVGDKYSVSVIPTICTSNPIMVSEIEREGVTYKQLMFGKGDCIISNSTVVNYSLKSYDFFEAFFMRAKVPWYVEYEDLVKSMDNLVKYAASEVGGSLVANELVTSFVTRSIKDKSVYYRQVGGMGEFAYADLMNVYHSAIGTINKLAGNYLTNGITSALVQQNTGETKLEKHMRG